MLLLSQKGSTLIEGLFSLVALKGLIFFILFVSYFYIAKTTISDIGYQALICIAKNNSLDSCKSNSVQRLKAALPIGKVENFKLKKYRGRYKVQILWTAPGSFNVNYKKSLRY